VSHRVGAGPNPLNDACTITSSLLETPRVASKQRKHILQNLPLRFTQKDRYPTSGGINGLGKTTWS
jgi:ABC-type molybdenum transport system ATPase subunit/photorepair protein PhrA